MRSLLERIDSRPWPGDFLARAVGNHVGSFFSHAADPELRESAASGGTVTAILIHLLEAGRIDGALVVTSVVTDGKLECRFAIARTRDEILMAQGSKYAAVYFQRDAVPLIRAFRGCVAAVLLPCDAKSLRRLRIAEPELDAKIAFVMTLFCGHNSEPELTDAMIAKYGRLVAPCATSSTDSGTGAENCAFALRTVPKSFAHSPIFRSIRICFFLTEEMPCLLRPPGLLLRSGGRGYLEPEDEAGSNQEEFNRHPQPQGSGPAARTREPARIEP